LFDALESRTKNNNNGPSVSVRKGSANESSQKAKDERRKNGGNAMVDITVKKRKSLLSTES